MPVRDHKRVMQEVHHEMRPTLQLERMPIHVQFLAHMRYIISNDVTLMSGCVVNFCGEAIPAPRCEKVVKGIHDYAFKLACILDDSVVGEVDFFLFVIEALAGTTHGMFGHCLRSLYSPDKISVRVPTGGQDFAAWTLLQTVMNLSDLHAENIVDNCIERIPHALACIGFMCFLVRTPLSSALLTVGKIDNTGLSAIFGAMINSVEPCRMRTPFDVVMHTAFPNEFFAAHSVCKQFHAMADLWLRPLPFSSLPDQLGVQSGTADIRLNSLLNLSRSGLLFTGEWKRLACKTAEALESKKGVPDELVCRSAQVWASVWVNTLNTLLLSTFAVSRRHHTSVLVIWFYNNDAFCCIARNISVPPSDASCVKRWASQCSDAVENLLRTTGVVPVPPIGRKQRRNAIKMLRCVNRWHCATLKNDQTSREVMSRINAAMCMPEDRGLKVVQSGFNFACSVALVSYKMPQ